MAALDCFLTVGNSETLYTIGMRERLGANFKIILKRRDDTMIDRLTWVNTFFHESF